MVSSRVRVIAIKLWSRLLLAWDGVFPLVDLVPGTRQGLCPCSLVPITLNYVGSTGHKGHRGAAVGSPWQGYVTGLRERNPKRFWLAATLTTTTGAGLPF